MVKVPGHICLPLFLAIFLILMWQGAACGQQNQDRRFTDTLLELDIASDPLLHSLLVFHKGLLIVERYWAGSDLVYGEPQDRAFGPHDLHDLRSCSKSVVGLLVGIALRDEKIPGAHFPAYTLFPDLKLEQSEAFTDRHRAIKIRHLLDMKTGLDWQQHESEDHVNNESKLEGSLNAAEYVWAQPMVSLPGQKFNYNSGATALLGRAIKRGTGNSLEKYAREKLFSPLEITKWEWLKDSDGDTAAHYGLRLTPRDMMKIGRLILQKGKWKGKEVVPKEWIESLLNYRGKDDSYRSQWWLEKYTIGNKKYRGIGAKGKGGQQILALPELGAVVVATAGHYEDREANQRANKFIRQEIVPKLLLK